MRTFAAVRAADGVVSHLIAVQDLDTLGLNLPDDCHPVPCDDARVWTGKWRWTEATGFAPAPDAMSIAELRAAAWERVKVARSKAEIAGCTTPLGRVDTDQTSRVKISGAVQLAMIAQAAGKSFAIDWTMEDNSVVPHDAAAIIAMGVAVGEHIAACHEQALVKRAAIDAAQSAADIAAVEVDHGWPA